MKKTVSLELQPCLGQRSGVGIYTYELARHLQDTETLHFRGDLCNFLGRHDMASDLEGVDQEIRECRWMPYPVWSRLSGCMPVPERMLFGSADLSVFFDYVVPAGTGGIAAATIYDMTLARFPETMKPRNYRRLKKGLELSVHRARHIITISEFSRREIMECLDVPAERISVIHSAPSFTGGTADFSAVSARFGLDVPYILYVGTIEPRKNLSRLIRAYELLRQRERLPHRLVLAGGSGWQNAEILQTAECSPFRDDIVFTGYISNEEKNVLYEHAQVFVFPSLYEGFGMPPLEAMGRGCPVVCSRAASLPEVVGDAALLADPLEEEALAQAMYRVLSEEPLRRELIAGGRKQAAQFTWEESARRLTALCEELCGN